MIEHMLHLLLLMREQHEHDNGPSLEWEVRDELIQQHALSTCQGRACTKCCDQHCQDCFWSYRCIATFGRLAFFVSLVSLAFLIMLGVSFIGPSLRSPYKVTQCDVVSVESEEGFNCDNRLAVGLTLGDLFATTPGSAQDCKTKTTCVKVKVEYTRDGEKVHGMLYRPDQCTNNLREGSSALNMMRDYKPPHSFECLYDATKFSTRVTINYSLLNTPQVVHMLFWPIVIIILCIAAAVFLMYTSGCHWYARKPPQDVRTIAANLRLQGIQRLMSLTVEERKRLVRECSPDPEEELQIQQMQRV